MFNQFLNLCLALVCDALDLLVNDNLNLRRVWFSDEFSVGESDMFQFLGHTEFSHQKADDSLCPFQVSISVGCNVTLESFLCCASRKIETDFSQQLFFSSQSDFILNGMRISFAGFGKGQNTQLDDWI